MSSKDPRNVPLQNTVGGRATVKMPAVDAGGKPLAKALPKEPTQAAPPPVGPPTNAPAAPTPGTLYVLGAKPYAPKVDHNERTWVKITAALATGPKTMQELYAAVGDHKGMVGYMIRGGHLAAQKNEQT